MKNLLILTSLAILTLPAFAQQGATPQSEDPIVIRIGDVEVPQSEFEALIESLPPEYRAYLQQPGGKRAFAKDFVEMKVLSIEAEKGGVADDPAVATQLKLVRDNTLASAMVARVEKSVEPAQSEIEALYEKKKADYEEVTARHILIAFEGSPASREDRKRTDDEAKALAEKLQADLKAGGDFAAAAKADSDDLFSGERGGELGAFGRGQMVPAFEDAVFGAEIGEIGIVRTQFGYHVIQVTDRSAKPLEDVRDEIRTALVQEALQERLNEMTSRFEVSYDDGYFGPKEEATPESEPGSSGSDS